MNKKGIGAGGKMIVIMFVIYAGFYMAMPEIFYADWMGEYWGFSGTLENFGTNENTTRNMLNNTAGGVVAGSPTGFWNPLSLIYEMITWFVGIVILPLAMFNAIPNFPWEITAILSGVWVLIYLVAFASFIRGSDF